MPTDKTTVKLRAEDLERRVAPTLMSADDLTGDGSTPEAKGTGKSSSGSVSGGTATGSGKMDVPHA